MAGLAREGLSALYQVGPLLNLAPTLLYWRPKHSFGSLNWPVLRPDLLVDLVSSLIEAHMPFLFAHSSESAVPTNELLDLVDSYGKNAMMIGHAPQEVVLAHEAVSFFLVRQLVGLVEMAAVLSAEEESYG